MNIFSARNVNVSLNNKIILDDINFSITNSGTITGLIGANGSGKTTLLKSICNFVPHNGNYKLNGENLNNLSSKELAKNISYIPQKTGINISISVLNVVLMGFNLRLKLLEQPSKEMVKSALSALEKTGIIHLKNRDYCTLSEGEKQLCILSRTIVEESTLMLLDEPDSALDFHNKYSMMNLLRDLTSNASKNAIISLHDPQLALEFCDQLLLIKDGSIVSKIFPQERDIKAMEDSFSLVYGPVSIFEANDKLFIMQKR